MYNEVLFTQTLNVPSINQCLHFFNKDRFVGVVKIIISSSSYNIKSSPRSVFRKLSGKRAFVSEHGVQRCLRIVLANEFGDGKLATEVKGINLNAECRIELEDSSDVAAFTLIWFLTSIAGMRSAFEACECVVGSDTNESIGRFVWQRAKKQTEVFVMCVTCL